MCQQSLFDLDSTGEAARSSPFSGWILRHDVTGRLGWEAPNLPARVRWWARYRFEELPTEDETAALTAGELPDCLERQRQEDREDMPAGGRGDVP